MSDPDRDAALTLAEAARLTGRSAEALRARWRRGTLKGFRGNDGRLRVYVDPADRVNGRVAGQADSAGRPGGRPAERPDAREEELATLRVRVAAAEAALVEVRGERDRLLAEAERRRWRGIVPALRTLLWGGG